MRFFGLFGGIPHTFYIQKPRICPIGDSPQIRIQKAQKVTLDKSGDMCYNKLVNSKGAERIFLSALSLYTGKVPPGYIARRKDEIYGHSGSFVVGCFLDIRHLVPDRRSTCLLYAGRLCNGGNGFHTSKECRQYHHEKPDGFLHRHSRVHAPRLRTAAR